MDQRTRYRDERTQDVLLLGVDGGGTGCRARLCDGRGRVLGEGTAGPANIRFGIGSGLTEARTAALQCLAEAGLGRADLGRVVACLGFAGATEAEALEAAQAHPHPFRKALITTDAHIACVGAHGGRDGGVLIVGTGTCGWALVGACQHRVGGWGFPVSDEASGAWLGCEAIRRTLWAHDGRIGWTRLLSAVFDRFDGNPGRIVGWMTDAKPVDFGTLAPLVVEHASQDDPVAVELMTLAASHIDAMATRLSALGARAIALAGGLSGPLRPWLSDATRSHLVPAEADALSGALLLARAHAPVPGKT